MVADGHIDEFVDADGEIDHGAGCNVRFNTECGGEQHAFGRKRVRGHDYAEANGAFAALVLGIEKRNAAVGRNCGKHIAARGAFEGEIIIVVNKPDIAAVYLIAAADADGNIHGLSGCGGHRGRADNGAAALRCALGENGRLSRKQQHSQNKGKDLFHGLLQIKITL